MDKFGSDIAFHTQAQREKLIYIGNANPYFRLVWAIYGK